MFLIEYFITSACAHKAKLTVNFLAFPLVKFLKLWQIGGKYFTLVGARLSGKSVRPVFCSGERRHKYEKIEKAAFTNPIFILFKIRIPLDAICCENFRRFHRRKFKKITNKTIKIVKNTFVGAFIIQD